MASTHRGGALVSVTDHYHRQLLSRDHFHHGLLRVERAIDGRDSIKGHGSTDMPVWGERLKRQSNPGNPRETAIRCRICGVIRHINSIQEK
jgi:hypothetical protein